MLTRLGEHYARDRPASGHPSPGLPDHGRSCFHIHSARQDSGPFQGTQRPSTITYPGAPSAQPTRVKQKIASAATASRKQNQLAGTSMTRPGTREASKRKIRSDLSHLTAPFLLSGTSCSSHASGSGGLSVLSAYKEACGCILSHSFYMWGPNATPSAIWIRPYGSSGQYEPDINQPPIGI